MSRLTDVGTGAARALDLRSPAGLQLDSTIVPVIVVEDSTREPYRPGRRQFAVSAQVTANAGVTGNLLLIADAVQLLVVERLYGWCTTAATLRSGKYSFVPPAAHGLVVTDYGTERNTIVRAIAPVTYPVGVVAVATAPGANPDWFLEQLKVPANENREFACTTPFVLRGGDILSITPTTNALTYGVVARGWWDE